MEVHLLKLVKSSVGDYYIQEQIINHIFTKK